MSKRERVIIFLMLFAVIYGGYTMLYKSPSKTGVSSPGKGTEDLNKYVIDVASRITDSSLTDFSNYIVAKASDNWTQNPFIEYELPVQAEVITDIAGDRTEGLIQESGLFYTGYLKIGDKSLAIINGTEFEAGEKLPQPGHFLRSIHPTWVEIGIEGDFQTIVIPMQEPVASPSDETPTEQRLDKQQQTYPLEEPASQPMDESIYDKFFDEQTTR